MSIQVRKHRGGLDESLKTTFNVSSRKELLDAINKDLKGFVPEIADTDLIIEPYGYDARIYWDTYMISSKKSGVYGFSNGPIPD